MQLPIISRFGSKDEKEAEFLRNPLRQTLNRKKQWIGISGRINVYFIDEMRGA